MPGIEPTKARQVYLLLRDRIAGGSLAEGTALPPEQMLAAEHAVSRITVRRALAELEREGLILRKQGAGTFATPRHDPKPMVADLSDVLANIVAMGRDTSVRLLAFGYDEATPTIAAALNLAKVERVQRAIRVRLLDGKPLSYLTTHVPERIGLTYSEAELASRPLLSLLERSGIAVAQATQEVSAALASPEVAAALDVETGSALIALTRIVLDEAGNGIEHLHALYRPDRYALRMDLMRIEGKHGKRWAPIANDPGDARGAAPDVRARAMRAAGPNKQRRRTRNGRGP
jgi:GntR family transcriptional regulator